MRKALTTMIVFAALAAATQANARDFQTRFTAPKNSAVQANLFENPLKRGTIQQAQNQCCVSKPCGTYCATTINGVCTRTETKYCSRCWC